MKVRIPFLLTLVFVVSSSLVFAAEEGFESRLAGRFINSSGVMGGLIVHIGCGDGKLTAALYSGDEYLVHGLSPDQSDVDEAREHLKSLGLYGDVSVARLEGTRLPYADDLVNLIVSTDLGDVSIDEVMRVLCPNGVAFIQRNRRLTKYVKPWPDEIGEWTHYLQDASNNAVAKDTKVGSPRRLKWACGPLWTRDHEFNSSLCAMVSGSGRLFYVFDEGLPGVTVASLPEKWTLIARDAFNGKLLWKRLLAEWGSDKWKNRALRSVPMTIPRRIVAQGERLFITLGYDSPISALDAATGNVLTTYEETDGAEEIRCVGGTLVYRKGKNTLAAITIHTGNKLWEVTGKIQPLSWAVQNGRVFYQNGATVLCLRASDGEELWSEQGQSPASMLVVHDGRVLLSRKQGLEALSAETGKSIWSINARAGRNELFVANGKLWHWQGNGIVGRDLNTGNLAKTLDTSDVFTPGHHFRCYQSKATENFIITPNRGAEFISVAGEANTQNDWLRGPCRYGIMPGNGLLYVGPNPCFCYPGVKLIGFNALAPAGTVRELSLAERLKRGNAYEQGGKLATSAQAGTDDWPSYRHDARRTGSVACEVPAQVVTQWRVSLKGKLTPPVLSADRVYVAAKNEHTLYVFGAKDGRTLWNYTAGGRIDSPPTIFGGLVLFGSADGCVYCLRASDGELVWRFRAAPCDQQIVAFGQLESPWRVHGSILLKDGVAYCTAGRSTYLDGGIRVFGLDPATGTVMHETCLDTWSRTRKDAAGKPFIPAYHMEGALSDVLVSEGDYIYMGQYKLDRTLARQKVPYIMSDPDNKVVGMDLMDKPFTEGMESQAKYEKVQHDWQWRVHKQMMEDYNKKYGGTSMGDRKMGLHVSSVSGFLDDSWFNRTFWTYSTSWPGYYIAHRGAKTGQLLVVGPSRTFAVQGYPSRNLQSPEFTPANKGYLLLADD
ncbi:MAG: outer membrane protein assembly factor BamB family protein, partial [Planctomycetota bacterium]